MKKLCSFNRNTGSEVALGINRPNIYYQNNYMYRHKAALQFAVKFSF